VRALELEAACRVLCVGLGTGNEAVALLEAAPHLDVSGIDLSPAALRICRRKLMRLGGRAELRLMDTARLRYPDCSFDRVLCMHVLDFVDEVEQSVREMIRVLAPGGRFTITVPSQPEGASMGVSLARDHVRAARRAGRGSLSAAVELLSLLPLGLLYLPLLARPQRRSFSQKQIEGLFAALPVDHLVIQAERVYQDFIVSGTRS